MNKPDLALNNLQWLVCHKTKQNQTKPTSREKRESYYKSYHKNHMKVQFW